MERCTRSSWTRPSKKVEVFIVLPGGRLLRAHPVLVQPGLEAAQLAALELYVIADEQVAELLAEQRVLVQRVERLVQAPGQHRPVGGVRLVVARPGLQLALDAVQAADELRGDVEVGI